ncbi:MAG: GntR family transcriptional regulator [Nitrospirae bacterium]|nr:GntR family transcriptional regulator [Nitrospirota bacterium]
MMEKQGQDMETMIINKKSPVAAYKQLKDIIYRKIKDGEFKPHEMMPSEAELCKQYNISRTTVRLALRKLIDDGLLYTIKGKGTFVAEPKIDQIMIKIPDFYEDMAERGLKPDVRVLDIKIIEASQLISEKLMIPLNEKVFRIKRLFLADNKPYILEKKFIVCRDCRILSSCSGNFSYNLENNEVFDVLAGKCHICREYADVSIEATTIRPHESRYLNVPVGSVAFYVDMVAYKKDDTPCGWIASVMRGDLYRFRTRVFNYPLAK